MSEIGKIVRQFYNERPFPNFDLNRFNSIEDLRLAAYPFASILDRSIPENASIVDVGTGTGQLSAYLSLRRKYVLGIDYSDGALNKANLLKQKLNLKTWHLKKIDILNTKEIEEIGMQFDYLLCLGVLHHVSDPYLAFTNILKLLKPNGRLAIGLYNKFGRIPLKIRKIFARTILRNNQTLQDYFLKMQINYFDDKERARGVWNDQYLHPHETSHTVGQVLGWFKKNNIKYIQTVPCLNSWASNNLEFAGVWNATNEISPLLIWRVIGQLSWIWRTQHEGGYWITFGEKTL